MRKFVGAVLAGLVFASGAQALTLKPARQPFQRWVDASHVATPSGAIPFKVGGPSPCGGLGCFGGTEGIWIAAGVPRQRATLLHEVGHYFDFALMTDGDREAFMQIDRGKIERWWRSSAARSGGLEWFADSYSICARVPPTEMVRGRSYSTGSGITGAADIRRVCRLIARVG